MNRIARVAVCTVCLSAILVALARTSSRADDWLPVDPQTSP